MTERERQTFTESSKSITAPILRDFVTWVLKEAMLRGIYTLYFLARDGYLLCEIAKRLANTFDLPIKCRYLYCSRKSLRLPTYHLIGEEAFSLLFASGFSTTLTTILDRAALSECQRILVREDLGISDKDENRVLSRSELNCLAKQFKGSKRYCEYVYENSKEAYGPTIGYLTQEGLFDQAQIAIVDSGWSGSVQRSIRQLLNSAGFSGTILGFYFGMYTPPKEKQDGTYLTWFFNWKEKSLRKALFCNNLFECMLSAPHGMTLAYQYENTCFIPVLAAIENTAQAEMIHTQIDNVLDEISICVASTHWKQFDAVKARKAAAKKLRRFMIAPTMLEASSYGAFLFDDDICDSNQSRLAGKEQIFRLNSYLLHKRIFRKIGKMEPVRELFWPYGTIAFVPVWKQAWYRWNILVWDLLKAFIL